MDTPRRPPRLPGCVRDLSLQSSGGVPVKASSVQIPPARSSSPYSQRLGHPGPGRSPSPTRTPPHRQLNPSSVKLTPPSRPQLASAETPTLTNSATRPFSFNPPPASPTQPLTPSGMPEGASSYHQARPSVHTALVASSPRGGDGTASSPSGAPVAVPRLHLGAVRYSTPLPQPRAPSMSPGTAFSQAPVGGSPHVWFNRYRNSQHDITPYAEIYGLHPRFFNFNEQGEMVPPSPLPSSTLPSNAMPPAAAALQSPNPVQSQCCGPKSCGKMLSMGSDLDALERKMSLVLGGDAPTCAQMPSTVAATSQRVGYCAGQVARTPASHKDGLLAGRCSLEGDDALSFAHHAHQGGGPGSVTAEFLAAIRGGA